MHLIPLPMQKGAEACNPMQSLENTLSLSDSLFFVFLSWFQIYFLLFREKVQNQEKRGNENNERKSHRLQNENSSLFFFHCKNIYSEREKWGNLFVHRRANRLTPPDLHESTLFLLSPFSSSCSEEERRERWKPIVSVQRIFIGSSVRRQFVVTNWRLALTRWFGRVAVITSFSSVGMLWQTS